MKTRTRQDYRRGIGSTLTEVLATLAVILLVGGLMLPRFSHCRVRSHPVTCLNNLKNVGLAYRIFSTDHNGRFPWDEAVTNGGVALRFGDPAVETWMAMAVISNELSTPRILACSLDREREVARDFRQFAQQPAPKLGRNHYVSYFVGVDAKEEQPMSILAGDRNLMTNGVDVGPGWLALGTNQLAGFAATVHKNCGNLLLGDGSVLQVTSGRLRESVADAEKALGGPARLLVP